MRFLQACLMFLGRVCLSLIFILAAYKKVVDWNGTAEYMASKGMTYIPFFLVAAMCFEFFGGLSLLVGYKTRIGACILLIFLIPATLIFHDFWNLDEAAQPLQTIMFLKNLAIAGGLLQVLATGGGGCAFDSCHSKHSGAKE